MEEENKIIEGFYRGESKDHGKTKCMPSIFRDIIGEEDRFINENKYYQTCIDFLTQNNILKESEDLNESEKGKKSNIKSDAINALLKEHTIKTVKELGYLQHYGFNTRLLDVTRNEKIAIYFACSNHFNENGYVYNFYQNNMIVLKSEDAYTVKRKIECISKINNLINVNVIDYFTKEENRKDSIHKETIENNAILDYTSVFPTSAQNVRYEKQSGSFILFGYKLIDNKYLPKDINKLPTSTYLTITPIEKITRLYKLSAEGINSVNVYPDKEDSYEIVAKHKELLLYKDNKIKLVSKFVKYIEKKYKINLTEIEENDPDIIDYKLVLNIVNDDNNFYFFCKELLDIVTFLNNNEDLKKQGIEINIFKYLKSTDDFKKLVNIEILNYIKETMKKENN